VNWFAKAIRYATKLRFRIVGLATIKDIPTAQFNSLRDELRSEGWVQTYEYNGFDAWIDYGCLKLRNGGNELRLEWDNWTEGSVEGPSNLVTGLAEKMQMPVSREWRWSEYDDQRAPNNAMQARRQSRAPDGRR
jgi:hypothetical protein